MVMNYTSTKNIVIPMVKKIFYNRLTKKETSFQTAIFIKM